MIVSKSLNNSLEDDQLFLTSHGWDEDDTEETDPLRLQSHIGIAEVLGLRLGKSGVCRVRTLPLELVLLHRIVVLVVVNGALGNLNGGRLEAVVGVGVEVKCVFLNIKRHIFFGGAVKEVSQIFYTHEDLVASLGLKQNFQSL